jgi:hypothetical protein
MKIPEEPAISTLQMLLVQFQIKTINSSNNQRNATQKILDDILSKDKKITILRTNDNSLNI